MVRPKSVKGSEVQDEDVDQPLLDRPVRRQRDDRQQVPPRPVADAQSNDEGDRERGDQDARAAVAQKDRQGFAQGARTVGRVERGAGVAARIGQLRGGGGHRPVSSCCSS